MGMNVDNLYYIIRKIVQKKYPWINDVVITHRYDDEDRFLYGVEIHADRKFKEQEIFMDRYEVEIEDELKSAFEMMGPERWERFDRVTIF